MKNRLKDSIYQKLVLPIIGYLKQGISPRKLALSVSLGVVFGTFPIIGITTLLCLVAALILRLNMAAIQLINYFIYPIQLLLMIPLVRLGAAIFGANPIPYSVEEMLQMIEADWVNALELLWVAAFYGIVGWFVVALPVGVLLFYIFQSIFRKMEAKN